MKPQKRTQGMNWITKKKRLSIYIRDGLACAYCGLTVEDGASLSIDHLTPYSKGGTNDQSNLVTCCAKCNSSRQDRPWKEFAGKVAGYVNIPAKAIERHIQNCISRPLDGKAAQEIIDRRAGWTAIVQNNYK